ncbi:unnamed protein product [Prunus brigantina]
MPLRIKWGRAPRSKYTERRIIWIGTFQPNIPSQPTRRVCEEGKVLEEDADESLFKVVEEVAIKKELLSAAVADNSVGSKSTNGLEEDTTGFVKKARYWKNMLMNHWLRLLKK